MEKIEIAIGKLLFDHDCVVIPSFGGLLANYVGAEIHPVTNALKPPRKRIAFNESLLLNDGLLQNFLVLEEGVSHAEALDLISEYVTEINDQIKHVGAYQLDGTGSFIRNEENKIQFQPADETNFLDESFGLTELYYRPIQRQQNDMKQVQPNQGRPVRKAAEKEANESTELVENSENKKGKGIFIIIPSVLVVLAVSIYFFTTNSNGDIQHAGFTTNPTEMSVDEDVIGEAEESIESEEVVTEHEDGYHDEEMVEPLEGMQFYIIAGVFSVEENAHKFTTLYHQGEVIHDGDFYRVHLGGFSSREDAKLHIEDFRNNYGEELWILEHE